LLESVSVVGFFLCILIREKRVENVAGLRRVFALHDFLISGINFSPQAGAVTLSALRKRRAGRDAVLDQQEKLVLRQRLAEIESLHLVAFVGAQEA
jgi:hypothetical protein